MARRFARRGPSRQPKTLIVVVTEGTSTEPGYLKLFKRLHGSESAALKVIPLGADPRAVVERAIDETPLDSDKSSDDSVWAVFDRDDHERFNEAVDRARGKGIKTAVSNPCFELWCILHYELLDAPTHRRDCQRRLGRLCPGYRQSSGKRFEDAGVVGGQHAEAVERARELLKRRSRQGQPLGNPSTTVHELTEWIRQGHRPY